MPRLGQTLRFCSRQNLKFNTQLITQSFRRFPKGAANKVLADLRITIAPPGIKYSYRILYHVSAPQSANPNHLALLGCQNT